MERSTASARSSTRCWNSSTLLPDYGLTAIALAVVIYGVAITATMSLLGAGAGTLFGLTYERGITIHGVAQLVIGLAIAGLAGSLLLELAPTLF